MATYTAAAGGGNWNAAATWGGGGFPAAGDTANLNAGSGQVTINVASACLVLNCTGYTGTLTFNNTLTIATGGSATFVSGQQNLGGSSALIMTGTVSLTTGGKSIPALTFGAAAAACTVTLNSNATVTGLFNIASTTQTTNINGNAAGYTITCNGGLTTGGTLSSASNAPKIILGGGTWTGPTYNNGLDTDIQGNVILAAANVRFGSSTARTLKWVSGTVTTTNNTLLITNNSTLQLRNTDTAIGSTGVTLNSITPTSGITLTLSSGLLLAGRITLAAASLTFANSGGTAWTVSVDTFIQYATTSGVTLTMASGQTLEVTYLLRILGSGAAAFTVVAASGSMNLIFSGSNEFQMCFRGIFTNVNASGGKQIFSFIDQGSSGNTNIMIADATSQLRGAFSKSNIASGGCV